MSTVHQAFGVLEDRIRSTHIHDNQGIRDSHLWPGEGTIDWEQTMQLLRSAPHAPALLMEIEGQESVDSNSKMVEAFKKLESIAAPVE